MDENKPRLIVLPLQPGQDEPLAGIGLGVHFFLGNIVATHPAFKEFWFGWRIKKIFLEKKRLAAYCHGEGPRLNITALGEKQKIRYWLHGRVKQHQDGMKVSLVLTDTRGKSEEQTTELILDPADHLIGFQKAFLAWLDNCGFPAPDGQAAATIWPEKTTVNSLDLLGQDLETYYLDSSWGDSGRHDPGLFDPAVSTAPSSYLALDLKAWVLYKNKQYKAADESFRSAIKINATGIGAMSGRMWCAVYTNDKESAYKWATAKADIRRESRKAARAGVDKRMKKALATAG
jgi:hypothetical protein